MTGPQFVRKAFVVFALFASLLAIHPVLSAEPAKEQLPPGTQLVSLEVFPPKLELKHTYDYAQLLITGKTASGERIDVTRMADVTAPANLVTVSETRMVQPKADGQGELAIAIAGQTAKIPLAVKGFSENHEVSFVREIMPILGKKGCNAGTCHGGQNGKNGFQLSLRGYDPMFDYQSLTDDLGGRRFNRSAPAQSLMLLKPSGEVPHQGGVVTQPGDRHYELLRAWIAGGVKLDLDSPRVARIELQPQNPQLPLAGNAQQMLVMATYTDGTVRDVTAEAFVESSLAEVVELDKRGLATAIRRGEAAILARFEGSYAATTVTVMGDRSGYQWTPVPENNYVDTLVYNKLKKAKILPGELCTDSEFIRRLYLDLTGVSPEPEDVRTFVNDPRPTKIKRDELVDRLVGSADYIDHWTHRWADLMQVNRKYLGEKGTWALLHWIRQAVASNMPYDKFAYQVLTGSGSTHENPAAGYYRVVREPGEAVENITHLFLSIRFNCNKCHDHPFERWTQSQYYETAAFFAQIGRKPGTVPEDEIIYDTAGGEVRHARTNVVMTPKVPFQEALSPADGSRREQLARWITSKDNQYFAMSMTNRLWSYLLGLGIIDPIDDIRAGNPATNPELLKKLTDEFIASGFNIQEVIRTICKSRVYQHSIEANQWNVDDKINFSHALPRRLPAEVLLDTIYRSTGASIRFPGMPVGFKASQLPDSSINVKGGFLDLFGRPPRESPCECERASGVVLGQIQNLINGPIVAEAISAPDNRITKLVNTEKDDAKLVEALFLAILSKTPSEKELAAGLQAIKSGGDDRLDLDLALAKYEKEQLPLKQAEWEASVGKETVWSALDPADMKSAGGATFAKQPDGSILVSGGNPLADTYTITATTELQGITGVRLEVLSDPSLAAQGPGRAANGNFVLNEFRLTAAPKADPAKANPAPLGGASADFSQESWAVAGAVDGNPGTGWAVAPAFGKPHTAIFETRDLVGAAGGTTLTFTLEQQFGMQHTIGKFRLSATVSKRPLGAKPTLPEPIAALLAVPSDQRTDAQKAELTKFYRTFDPELARLTQLIALRAGQSTDPRLLGAQDLVWALINSPSFLFNR